MKVLLHGGHSYFFQKVSLFDDVGIFHAMTRLDNTLVFCCKREETAEFLSYFSCIFPEFRIFIRENGDRIGFRYDIPSKKNVMC